jgi:hypothetical protein
MTNKIKKKSVFTEKELKYLPLTYRKMEVEETKSVGELYLGSMYSKSNKHFSKKYMVFNSHKPISNFIIDDDTI